MSMNQWLLHASHSSHFWIGGLLWQFSYACPTIICWVGEGVITCLFSSQVFRLRRSTLEELYKITLSYTLFHMLFLKGDIGDIGMLPLNGGVYVLSIWILGAGGTFAIAEVRRHDIQDWVIKCKAAPTSTPGCLSLVTMWWGISGHVRKPYMSTPDSSSI